MKCKCSSDWLLIVANTAKGKAYAYGDKSPEPRGNVTGQGGGHRLHDTQVAYNPGR